MPQRHSMKLAQILALHGSQPDEWQSMKERHDRPEDGQGNRIQTWRPAISRRATILFADRGEA